jgi:hypothetical protein
MLTRDQQVVLIFQTARFEEKKKKIQQQQKLELIFPKFKQMIMISNNI